MSKSVFYNLILVSHTPPKNTFLCSVCNSIFPTHAQFYNSIGVAPYLSFLPSTITLRSRWIGSDHYGLGEMIRRVFLFGCICLFDMQSKGNVMKLCLKSWECQVQWTIRECPLKMTIMIILPLLLDDHMYQGKSN